MLATVVIPARLASTRLPGKPLLDVGGLPMVERVRRQASRAQRVQRVVVATPDEAIVEVVRRHGGEAVLTGPASCGTERVAAALATDSQQLVVNVQGDMPLLDPDHVDVVVALLEAGSAVSTLATELLASDRQAPAVVKVWANAQGRAQRFSRDLAARGDLPRRHVGIYGFTTPALRRCAELSRSAGVQAASLEQLSWMEAGIPIDVGVVGPVVTAVDTAAQLAVVRQLLEGGSEAT